ncbi:MAG: hypothetical protein LAO04_11295 [Acidobacteriia bacterium]|nr:hypothetical protein [Terriglobia bacterium]
MWKVLQRLNVLAICLLGGVLAAVLVAQIWPRVRALAQADPRDDEWTGQSTWPRTLQVYPAHEGDPVKLVKITKAGQELVPGKYELPQIAGDTSQNVDAAKDWLSDVSFTLKSQTPKNIVSVGAAFVLPVRRTDLACFYGDRSGLSAWCEAHPHWCDGGCPTLVHTTLHWGLVPAVTASGLGARYRAEATGKYGDRALLHGKGSLQLGAGQEIELSPAGRVDGMMGGTDPRSGFSVTLDGILYAEGIEEARDAEPCSSRHALRRGCAFADVSKFNIGIDIVYFEDGTIWGNYGYGYAKPNADGIYTRLGGDDPPSIVAPPGASVN